MIKQEYVDKYKQHIVAIFRAKLDGEYNSADEDIPFDRGDIDWAEKEHSLERIKNTADLPYNLRGRSSLPDELAQHGYDSVIRDIESHRKDAAYLITKRKQIIDLPSPNDFRSINTRTIPDLVKSYTSNNEQGVLTLVRYLDLIPQFLELNKCYHLQDHLQTSGPAGQVEIDGLYIGSNGNEHQVVIVEGKDRVEDFTRNQLALNALTIRSKDEYPDSVITVGVKPEKSDIFSIVKFDVPISRSEGLVEVDSIKGYSFGQMRLTDMM